jgi:hypothetical protein
MSMNSIGIRHIDHWSNVSASSTRQVVQHYITHPYLVRERRKVELHFFVQITDVSPLRVYFSHDGFIVLGSQDFVLKGPETNNCITLKLHPEECNMTLSDRARDLVQRSQEFFPALEAQDSSFKAEQIQ